MEMRQQHRRHDENDHQPARGREECGGWANQNGVDKRNLLYWQLLSRKSMRILILGGTGFTGTSQVRYALSRGHCVTVFNRAKTQPGTLPKGVEQLLGDRNGQLDALKQGGPWDAVIDNPSTLPAWVRDAARILQGRAGRYIFISTISVYADHSRPGQDESGAVHQYAGADPMRETQDTLLASKYALYGPLKALAEQEAERWFPGRTLVLRPGLIVGPGDESDRFTYWPVRLAAGGAVLAPGTPADPVQIIDARDFAEWTIRMAETGETGVYNATGPATPLTLGAMLGAIQEAVGGESSLEWVDADFLAAQNVAPWTDLPVWAPPIGAMAGFTRVDNRRALEKGLVFRPLAETARDTLAWFKTLPAARQASLKAGLTPERECAVLKALRERVVRRC
jgi:2'-hydroxyisoflavone reductase